MRYARLYHATAIVCWNHRDRFCRAHADLIQILDDDGTLLIGQVIGFAVIPSSAARVEAGPGRIRVSEIAHAR